MKFLKNILDSSTLRTIYYSLIESRLKYGIIAWGSAVKDHLKKLEIIQKLFLKIILGKPSFFPSNDLFNEAKILDLRQLYFYTVVLYQFHNRNTLIQPVHSHATRQKLKYISPFCDKSIGQRSFIFLAPKLYSELPENIRNLTNCHIFKKHSKSFICDFDRTRTHDLIEMKNN